MTIFLTSQLYSQDFEKLQLVREYVEYNDSTSLQKLKRIFKKKHSKNDTLTCRINKMYSTNKNDTLIIEKYDLNGLLRSTGLAIIKKRNNVIKVGNWKYYDENKRMLPTRFMFAKFKKVIEKFLNNELSEIEKVVLMPGIRGIGKTTLLAQTYAIEKFLKPKDRNLLENIGKLEERLYLDVSQLRSDQISLNEFFNFYEEIREFHFEKPQKKILILLDEVHFDENWGLFLKTIFDRTKGHRDILVIATGSSALQIKMIPDLGRRTDIWEIFPMKLNEYLILKYGKYPLPGLSDYLQDALFNSSNATEVFERLKIKSKSKFLSCIGKILCQV